MPWLDGLRGVLVDVDGTLITGAGALPGAVRLLDRLRARALRTRITTNTTRMSIGAVAESLRRAGLVVDPAEIIAPSILARRRILESGKTRAMLLVAAEAKVDFLGVEEVLDEADWVVLGDLGRDFTWDRLNHAFRSIQRGAQLLALQKNPFWYAGPEGHLLDAGAFVAALEYATGTTAECVGKPSRRFFELALESLGLPANEVLVVGDDPLTDGAGGAAAGCCTALVRTGKYASSKEAPGAFAPDLILESLDDLL